jgi:hypothetical protein
MRCRTSRNELVQRGMAPTNAAFIGIKSDEGRR